MDGHPLTVVGLDAGPVERITVDSVVLLAEQAMEVEKTPKKSADGIGLGLFQWI